MTLPEIRAQTERIPLVRISIRPIHSADATPTPNIPRRTRPKRKRLFSEFDGTSNEVSRSGLGVQTTADPRIAKQFSIELRRRRPRT